MKLNDFFFDTGSTYKSFHFTYLVKRIVITMPLILKKKNFMCDVIRSLQIP